MVSGIHGFTGPRESISYDTLCSFLESYGTAQCSVPTCILIVFIAVFARPYNLRTAFIGIRRCSCRLLYYSLHIPSLAKWLAWFNLLVSVYRPDEP